MRLITTNNGDSPQNTTMSKILVYGSRGWIGGQFIDVLKSNNATYVNGSARVDDVTGLIEEIERVTPTHVVSFIGRTHGTTPDGRTFTTIDYLEQKGMVKENVRDNLFAPLCLAVICKERDVHFTYLGTGCIFKFDEEHPVMESNGFTEESLPNFFGSSYSVVKGYTDRLMHLFDSSVLNLRIRMPITGEDNPRNFITKIKSYAKICSIPNSMTVLPELLPFVFRMMGDRLTGTVNLTNPGLVSHNEILAMYREIVDPAFSWENFSVEEQNKILASERSNNFLETKKLKNLFPEVLGIKDSIRKLLKTYKVGDITRQVSTTSTNGDSTTAGQTNGNGTATSVSEETSELVDSPDTVLLVTGGYGFIASQFINEIRLTYTKMRIVVIDAMYYCATPENVDQHIRTAPNYKFIKGNLCSYDLVRHVVEDESVTHVIHFAAQSHVENSFNNALQYTNDNIVGTHNLLEACRKYGKVQKFIHVSTDEVYGESMLDVEEHHKTEQAILCPTNPYAATKAGAELIAQSYHHSFKMPIIITRGNNVYGPGQYPEKVIPRFIQLLKKDKPVEIQGDGSCVRSFIHSSDTANAFIRILQRGRIGEIYNIGGESTDEHSVIEVARMLIQKIKGTTDYDKWITYIPDRPFNDKRYYISNAKLKKLGWSLKMDFDDAINKLIPKY